MVKTVLIYIENEKNEYLMLYRNKKEKDPNEGKWMGVGGHIEDGETPDDAVIRETKEETGLVLLNIKYQGVVLFSNDEYEELMYLYTSNSYSGDIIECNEGILRWISKYELDDYNMWAGDRIFLNKILNNEDIFSIKLIYEKNEFIRGEDYDISKVY